MPRKKKCPASISRVNGWLDQLSPFPKAELALDDAGVLSLDLDDGGVLVLQLEANQGLLFVHLELVSVPLSANERAALLEHAMRLNLHTMATGGATIGLDSAAETLVLSIVRSIDELSADRLIAILESLTRLAPELRAELRESAAGGLSEPDPSSALLRIRA